MKKLSALLAGVLFGAGLAGSGMTDTAKVLGFLDIFGNWIPDLAFVMGAALLTTFVGFKWVLSRQSHPLFEADFSLPTKTLIDKQLLVGASVFGIGWGLFGYCPGPAVAALAYLSPTTIVFVVAMTIGLFIGSKIESSLFNNKE